MIEPQRASSARASCAASAGGIAYASAPPAAKSSRISRLAIAWPRCLYTPSSVSRAMPARYPERIVCLTEETTETLYLLGEERRIVGISGYTVRPPRARREKPRVSAFLSAKNEKILEIGRAHV